jgi:flavin reductase (DIM6/NTAB) family NADH-FMN oxidoreductase RutF
MMQDWIQVLAKMTYGIYALTTFHEQEINAMIASWASQISYDPPMIMIAVHPQRYSHRLIEQSGYFALHILARTQTDLLDRLKGSDPRAKFASLRWVRGKTGCPLLQECVAYLECKVKTSCRPGNHTLFIAEIVAAKAFSEENPLSMLDYPEVYLGKD